MTAPALDVDLRHGDCLDVLRTLPTDSVHAIITDPPYGLANTTPAQVADTVVRWARGDRTFVPDGAGFMGKAWDAFVPPPAVWDECFRVLKPGGHLLCFAGTRTVDLMTLGIRLAGFDVRDTITWIYGSGFPKSLDVGKAIDKAAGAIREVVGVRRYADGTAGHFSDAAVYGAVTHGAQKLDTAPSTPEAAQWHGWGTALKPASEPIVVARKPFAGTVAANVLAHGTGALNIDATRVVAEPGRPYPATPGGSFKLHGCRDITELRVLAARGERTPDGRDAAATLARYEAESFRDADPGKVRTTDVGRWPANVVMDGAAADALDEQSGTSRSPSTPVRQGGRHGFGPGEQNGAQREGFGVGYADTGGASRFFPVFRYEAKAPTTERPTIDGTAHPTVKPLDLMRWLVRLITPPGGTVLDPFAGSGTTIEAAVREHCRVIGIEREADYLPLIRARVNRCTLTGLHSIALPDPPATTPPPAPTPTRAGADQLDLFGEPTP